MGFKSWIKYLIGIAIFVAGLSYSLSSHEVMSREQVEFAAWISDLDAQNRVVGENNKDQAIRIKVLSNIPTIPLNWDIMEESRGTLDERVFRVLNLLKESDLALVSGEASPPAEGTLSITVAGPGKTVHAALNESEVRANLKVMNLLKVIEIYSTAPSPSPTAAPEVPEEFKLKESPNPVPSSEE